ncbi:hypothetical protein RB195_018167 [Necator americanus]|uniref:Uncharacterized protein n=1 Tax=Necator americanus TaxID=51031 RepID=A0ABR1C8I3_NECAM
MPLRFAVPAVTMLKLLLPLQKLVRKGCTKTHPNDYEEALSWLVETASRKNISPEEFRVLHFERPWATAPVVITHGWKAELDMSANGLIRWLHNPERDVNIEFDSQDSLYTVQVKAVFYAILSAMFHRVSHVIIYTPNEIVVKVGNGIFNPKKETKLFQGIRRRTLISEQDHDTQAKLHVLDGDALKKLHVTLEEATSRKNVSLCSENLFRERHSNELVRIT